MEYLGPRQNDWYNYYIQCASKNDYSDISTSIINQTLKFHNILSTFTINDYELELENKISMMPKEYHKRINYNELKNKQNEIMELKFDIFKEIIVEYSNKYIEIIKQNKRGQDDKILKRLLIQKKLLHDSLYLSVVDDTESLMYQRIDFNEVTKYLKPNNSREYLIGFEHVFKLYYFSDLINAYILALKFSHCLLKFYNLNGSINKKLNESRIKLTYTWQGRDKDLKELFNKILGKIITDDNLFYHFAVIFGTQPIDQIIEPIKWNSDKASEVIYFIKLLQDTNTIKIEGKTQGKSRMDYKRMQNCFVTNDGTPFKVDWKFLKTNIEINISEEFKDFADSLV